MTADSPIVEEVRQRAQALSARFNHDLNQYATHLRQIESSQRGRAWNQEELTEPTDCPDHLHRLASSRSFKKLPDNLIGARHLVLS
jgi:hypothetical protein